MAKPGRPTQSSSQRERTLVPVVPDCAAALATPITQRSAFDYRGPDALPDGGVLVVGASATGVQLAGELRRAGRPVTLAVGEHVRLPRTYRGRDAFWWLRATGVLAQRYDEVDDLARLRRLPSPQLSGAATAVDLASLAAEGVRLVGRLGRSSMARSFDSRARSATSARWPTSRRTASCVAPTTGRPLPGSTTTSHHPLASTGPRSRTVRPWPSTCSGKMSALSSWATGSRPDYSWLELPVLDR